MVEEEEEEEKAVKKEEKIEVLNKVERKKFG